MIAAALDLASPRHGLAALAQPQPPGGIDAVPAGGDRAGLDRLRAAVSLAIALATAAASLGRAVSLPGRGCSASPSWPWSSGCCCKGSPSPPLIRSSGSVDDGTLARGNAARARLAAVEVASSTWRRCSPGPGAPEQGRETAGRRSRNDLQLIFSRRPPRPQRVLSAADDARVIEVQRREAGPAARRGHHRRRGPPGRRAGSRSRGGPAATLRASDVRAIAALSGCRPPRRCCRPGRGGKPRSRWGCSRREARARRCPSLLQRGPRRGSGPPPRGSGR